MNRSNNGFSNGERGRKNWYKSKKKKKKKKKRKNHKKGPRPNIAENKFKEALKELLSQKFILGFEHSIKNGDIDKKGIDFLVYLQPSGLAWCPQIKSGSLDKYDRKLRNRHFQKHPLIRDVFFIKRGEEIESIKRRIIIMLNEAIQNTELL